MKRAVVRLPPEIVERLDGLAARLRAAHPGRSCSRANVVRALLAGELDAAERPEGFEELAQRAIPPLKRDARGAGLVAPTAHAPEKRRGAR